MNLRAASGVVPSRAAGATAPLERLGQRLRPAPPNPGPLRDAAAGDRALAARPARAAPLRRCGYAPPRATPAPRARRRVSGTGPGRDAVPGVAMVGTVPAAGRATA